MALTTLGIALGVAVLYLGQGLATPWLLSHYGLQLSLGLPSAYEWQLLGLVWLAVSAALRPLEALRRSVAARTSDDLQPLSDLGMPRELRPLIDALNQFNDRLRNLFERQSQFIADASHELRTPLAALKARVELGLRAQEPSIWRSTLEEAALNTDKLTHLANQLLSLARIESGARAIAEGGAQRLDLSQLARELGMALAPLAHARGIALALEAEQAVWVSGEPTLLNELLCNLLDNALAHTPVGGNVILRVLPAGVLEVEDDGPGIPEDELNEVLKPFYRVESSRNRSTGGTGLGLAIAQQLTQAMGGRLTLSNLDPRNYNTGSVYSGNGVNENSPPSPITVTV